MRRALGLTLALFVAVAASGNAVAQDTLKKIKDTGVVKIGNRDASNLS